MRPLPWLIGSALPLSLVLGLAAAPIAGCSASSSSSGGAFQPTLVQSELARVPAARVPDASLRAAVQANNAFAVDLYARVRADAGSSNLLTSPISASLALGMTYGGARGATATGMAAALHMSAGSDGASAVSPDDVIAGQNALQQALASRAATAMNAGGSGDGQPPVDDELQIVNEVWGQQGYPWASPFLDTLAKNYGTGVAVADFAHQFEQARHHINLWVSDQTSSRVANLLPPGSLDGTTRMVLVNAIHLKLPFAHRFDPSATAPGSFTRGDGATVQASYMNTQLTLPYVDDGSAQIVSLPLQGGQEALIIALPHGDLASYEAKLAAGSAALVPPTAQAPVVLSLPKTSFTSPTFSLAKPLQAMGMTDAFSATKADFTGLCAATPDGGTLYVHDVLQKATLAVQEGGVEAAAATAVIVDEDAGVALPPPNLVQMDVSRPYVISLVDVPTGAILFLGHVEDPTQSGGE